LSGSAPFKLKFGLKFLIGALQSMAVFILLFAGGIIVLNGKTEIGIVVAFISGLDRVLEPWREMIAFVRSTSSAKVQFDLIEGGWVRNYELHRTGAAQAFDQREILALTPTYSTTSAAPRGVTASSLENQILVSASTRLRALGRGRYRSKRTAAMVRERSAGRFR
jgi:hypothetical protein